MAHAQVAHPYLGLLESSAASVASDRASAVIIGTDQNMKRITAIMGEADSSVGQAQQPEHEREQPVDARPAACGDTPSETTECPACGVTMRLWAGYYRCRNCGFKESCCF